MPHDATNIIEGDYPNEYMGFVSRLMRAARVLKARYPDMLTMQKAGSVGGFLTGLTPELCAELMGVVRDSGKVRTLRERFMDAASPQRIVGDADMERSFHEALAAAPGIEDQLNGIAQTLNSADKGTDILNALNQGLVLTGKTPFPAP